LSRRLWRKSRKNLLVVDDFALEPMSRDESRDVTGAARELWRRSSRIAMKPE
jgi:hypothetical protein